MIIKLILTALILLNIYACNEDPTFSATGKNPDTAPLAIIDRFSENAGYLLIRNDDNGLPGPGEPIDFDTDPFLIQGLGPDGEIVKYYNFDVQPILSAPIYAFFYSDDGSLVQNQLNIVDVIPGVGTYNDLWHVIKVKVPRSYTANSITSVSALLSMNFSLEKTGLIVNCPVVPKGTTAKLRFTNESTDLTRAWYKDSLIFYLNFFEKTVNVENYQGEHPNVPLSDLYVSYKINPPEGDHISGYVLEENTMQTHNVMEALPENDNYSPLHDISVYDNKDFSNVSNLTSVLNSNILIEHSFLVNSPVVYVGK